MKSFSATVKPSGYSPSQIKKAYGIDDDFGTGKGKTIAIVVAYGSPYIKNDLEVFNEQFDLPSANLTIKNLGTQSLNLDWALETTLDVEWAHAMAPDARILLVAAASDYSFDLFEAMEYAVDSGADIISMSWGCYEKADFSKAEEYFSDSSAIFVAAAGDDGAGAIWPASSPLVIAVGGTTLKLDSSGNRISETAWSDSGGGVSKFETAPSWQNIFGISTTKRAMPDISFLADPTTGVSVYCSVKNSKNSSGWYVLGGTSLGAPACAGIIADLNEDTEYIQDASSFYDLAGTTSYTNSYNCFNDIQSGSNGYKALRGFDLVTGLGTPKCDNILDNADILFNYGAAYSAHVQRVGWQSYVSSGNKAGTEGKALRMEGIRIYLTGNVPDDASIIYQAHVQSKGWLSPVSDGQLAGTTGQAKRFEALRITIKGLPGYEVLYRAHVQSKGWEKTWQSTVNGTNISKASIAGTVGKALRLEAIEIQIKKMS